MDESSLAVVSAEKPVLSEANVVFRKWLRFLISYPFFRFIPKDKDVPKSRCEQEMSQGQTRLGRQGCVPRTPALIGAKVLL